MKNQKDRVAKMQAAKAEKSATFSKQKINIATGWTIQRFDELNWEIPPSKQRGGGPVSWYYGKLIDALYAVPDRMLNQGDKFTLSDILKQYREIREVIEKMHHLSFE